jgi:AcrR family transcriptional regulator
VDLSDRRRAIERRERIGMRLGRASFRLEMARLERTWAIVSAHREGWSVRDIAARVGLGPTRVHQLVSEPEAALVESALSVLRELGWPAPEDPVDGDDQAVADRLVDEAAALITCIEWLEQLAVGATPVVNLRPPEDWPSTDNVAVDHDRVLRVLRRIAGDIEELARGRRLADLPSAAVDADPRLRRRRRLGEPSIQAPTGPMSVSQGRRAWDEYERRLQRAGLPVPPNPYRHVLPFSKLNSLPLLLAPVLLGSRFP